MVSRNSTRRNRARTPHSISKTFPVSPGFIVGPSRQLDRVGEVAFQIENEIQALPVQNTAAVRRVQRTNNFVLAPAAGWMN